MVSVTQDGNLKKYLKTWKCYYIFLSHYHALIYQITIQPRPYCSENTRNHITTPHRFSSFPIIPNLIVFSTCTDNDRLFNNSPRFIIRPIADSITLNSCYLLELVWRVIYWLNWNKNLAQMDGDASKCYTIGLVCINDVVANIITLVTL